MRIPQKTFASILLPLFIFTQVLFPVIGARSAYAQVGGAASTVVCSGVLGFAEGLLGDAFSAIGDFAGEALSGIKNAVGGVVSGIGDTIGDFFGGGDSAFDIGDPELPPTPNLEGGLEFFGGSASAVSKIAGGGSVPVTDKPVENLLRDIAGETKQNRQENQEQNCNYGLKEYVLDLVARVVAITAIRTISQSIINWVQGGDVNFVSNLELAFDQVLDETGGFILKQQFPHVNFCGNIGAFLQLRLLRPSIERRFQCTISDIVANIENFQQRFENGGWEAFVRINVSPQNTPYGSYLKAIDTIAVEEARAARRLELQYLAGGGFLGVGKTVGSCEIINGQEVCKPLFEMELPGKQISDYISNTFNMPLTATAVSDEIDEALASLVNALIQKVIGTGLSFAGSSIYGGGSNRGNPFSESLPPGGVPTPTVPGQNIGGDIAFTLGSTDVLTANTALITLQNLLVSEQRALTASYDRIRDLQEQRATLVASQPTETPDPIISQQIFEIDQQIQEERQKAANSEAIIADIIAAQQQIIPAQQRLIDLKKSLANAASTEEQDALIQQINIAGLGVATSTQGIDISGLPLVAGTSKEDTQLILNESGRNVQNAIIILNELITAIDQAIAHPITDDNTKIQLGVQGNSAIVQRDLLMQSLTELANLSQELSNVSNQQQMLDVGKRVFNAILSATKRIATANTIIQTLQATLEPPFHQ